MNDLIKQASDAANSLYGLPGDAVLGLFALSLGYFLKLQSWYPNKQIPTAVMLVGLIGGPVLAMGHYDHKAAMTPQILTHVMIGAAVSFSVWGLHNKVLRKYETKIPILGALLMEEPDPPAPQPQPPAPTKVPLWFVALLLPAALLMGCVSFNTQMFRIEQSSTHLCATAYFGWTNYLAQFPVNPAMSNSVKSARLKAAATLNTFHVFRMEYKTNAVVKPQLEALLPTLSGTVSNFIWLANYYQTQERK